MAEQIGLRCDTTHEDGDAPAAKRARTLADYNKSVDGGGSAPPTKSPIARRAERSELVAVAPGDGPAQVAGGGRPAQREGVERRRVALEVGGGEAAGEARGAPHDEVEVALLRHFNFSVRGGRAGHSRVTGENF